MENLDNFILARTLHVFGVVIWIGGVAFVTTILIPSIKEMTNTNNKLELFEKLEGKFAFQARIVTVLTGFSGFYMLSFLNGWDRNTVILGLHELSTGIVVKFSVLNTLNLSVVDISHVLWSGVFNKNSDNLLREFIQ